MGNHKKICLKYRYNAIQIQVDVDSWFLRNTEETTPFASSFQLFFRPFLFGSRIVTDYCKEYVVLVLDSLDSFWAPKDSRRRGFANIAQFASSRAS